MTRLGLPHQTVSDNPIPQLVIGYVSVQGSESVFGRKGKRLRKSPKAYYAKKSDRDSVRRDLEKNGFSIISETALGMSVVAPGGAYEDITGGELQAIERLMYCEAGRTQYVTHLDMSATNSQPRSALGRPSQKP